MSDEKGILTTEEEKQLSVIVDDAIKTKGVLELVDGYLARIAIGYVDNSLVDKLKAELKAKLAVVAKLAIAEDLEGAESALADLLNSLVDVPVLDEDAEGLIFLGLIQLIAGAIKSAIEKKKAAVQA
jgi:hypothetical protein